MIAPSIHAEGEPQPCPHRFNLAAHAVGDPAARWPEREALVVVDGDAPDTARETWTFTEADARVRRAASALRAAGLRPGDRVLIRLDDGPQFPVAFFGAIAAGGVAMPLSTQLSAPELAIIAADARPALALLAEDAPDFDRAGARRVEPHSLSDAAPDDYADTGRDDPAFLVYTSGSTGRPKGVLHAQRSAWGRRAMRAGWHDFGPGDRVMHAGAFNWTYTLGVGLSDPWSAGATALLNAGSRAPEAWPVLAARWKPTVFAAVPGVYRQLLARGTDLRAGFASLRHALTAGEKLSADIHDGWLAATGVPLLESLGMSEISTYISSSPARQAGTSHAGWPQPGRRIAILSDDCATPAARGSEGLIAVDAADPGLMLGYWRHGSAPDLPLQGDWFVTGDRGVMEEDGRIAYRGREDDLMNAQGYRVAPQEVEACLATHPAVAEAAVAEWRPKPGVTLIGAWIVWRGPPDPDGLEAHARAALAAYKVPRGWFPVAALPRSPNGKLRRRALVPPQP
jgi:acyl-coenzyme A synthetase/AMP-(fatty) acid ligase